MEGEGLLKQLIELIGLPQNYVSGELEALMQSNGLNRSTVTLDDLRPVLAELVQDILLETKESLK